MSSSYRIEKFSNNIYRPVFVSGSLMTLVLCSGAFAGVCLDEPISGEAYKLVNEGSGLNLEVVSKSTDDNVPLIQFFSRSGLDNQKFTLTDLGDDTWAISPVHSDKLIVDADTGLVQQAAVDGDNQSWSLKPLSSGGFNIVSASTGKKVAADGDAISAFVSLTEADSDKNVFQNWYFNPVSATCSQTAVSLDGGAGNAEVYLSWGKPAGNVERLEIFYNTEAKAKGRTRITGLDDVTARSFTVTDLENGTDYWFWVKYMSDGVWYNTNAFHAVPDESPMLSQKTNPLKTELETYKDDLLTGSLEGDKAIADNIITWQLPSGGFYKHKVAVYNEPWDGESDRSKWYQKQTNADGTVTKIGIGTIDNDATVRELMLLADVYQRSGDTKYRDAARKALEYLFTMQYDKGGFPQVYPERTGTIYSNYVTFNDNAMIRVMYMLDKVEQRNWPFNGDVFTHQQRSDAELATKKGIKYIRRAQLYVDGNRTVWSAQHDPDNYEPLGARSYELASQSGKESALIAAYMMSIPQTQDVKQVVDGALSFYRNPAVQAADTKYIKRAKNSTDDTYNPIQTVEGKTMWYRFYDLDSTVPFFSGRLPTDDPAGNGKQYDLMDVEPERRYGYEWGGSYGEKLLKYANSVGYVAN